MDEEENQPYGIRHVEIQRISNKTNDSSESESNELDDSFHNVLLKNKKTKQKKKTRSTESDNVNLDSLLQAVIDINDRLSEQEEKIHQYEQQIQEDENEALSKFKSTRPRTAVLTYTKDECSHGDGESDKDSYRSLSKRSTSSKSTNFGRIKQRPLSAKTIDSVDTSNRLSMSFSNDTVRRIDMENQRLLKGILRAKSKNASVKPAGPVRVKSASTINRERKQQEIDRENMRMLLRLQAVKPTSHLRRDKLMMDHMKNERTSERLSKTKQRPVSAPVTRSTAASRGYRENEFLDLHNESNGSFRIGSAASLRSGKQSRASSANLTAPKKVVVKEYWEPGW